MRRRARLRFKPKNVRKPQGRIKEQQLSLQKTLARVERDVEAGDLGKARDRLEGLLRAYPSELLIRQRLGDVYWRLQYPERAGLHWYLIESGGPDMETAKRSFESRYGGDPWLMLDAIGFQGGLDSIAGTRADEVIRDLAKRARVTPAKLEAALRRRNPNEPTPDSLEPWWSRWLFVGVPAALILILVMACIGTVTAAKLLVGLFAG